MKDDVVSKLEVIDMIREMSPKLFSAETHDAYIDKQETMIRIGMMSSVKAVPIVHGRWINGKCDKCGGHAPFWVMATTYYPSKFCPHCGAKMDGNNHE